MFLIANMLPTAMSPVRSVCTQLNFTIGTLPSGEKIIREGEKILKILKFNI